MHNTHTTITLRQTVVRIFAHCASNAVDRNVSNPATSDVSISIKAVPAAGLVDIARNGRNGKNVTQSIKMQHTHTQLLTCTEPH